MQLIVIKILNCCPALINICPAYLRLLWSFAHVQLMIWFIISEWISSQQMLFHINSLHVLCFTDNMHIEIQSVPQIAVFHQKKKKNLMAEHLTIKKLRHNY